MEVLHEGSCGERWVLTSTGSILGPYNNDEDAQVIMAELGAHGVSSTAVEILGHMGA